MWGVAFISEDYSAMRNALKVLNDQFRKRRSVVTTARQRVLADNSFRVIQPNDTGDLLPYFIQVLNLETVQYAHAPSPAFFFALATYFFSTSINLLQS